jgi:AP-3 complex subunit beta
MTHTSIIIISRLARGIDDIKHPTARACVIWLVGQYAETEDSMSAMQAIADWAPDVLRKLAKSFGEEVCICYTQ